MNFRLTRRSGAAISLALALIVTIGVIASSAIAENMHMGTHEAKPKTSVKLFVKQDAMAGYNLHIVTKRFKWAPWNASKSHISGQGHAHLYVDGEKVTRLYGPWYFLGGLEKGTHTIKVSLNGNDHADYELDEKMIAAEQTIVVE